MTRPFASPLRRIPPVHSPVDAAAALRALLTRTPRDPVRQLERLLADRFDADEVILCGSGTQALQLALAAARADTGRDLAALPAYTCYDIVSAAMGAAVRPAFYDLDPDTLMPESRSLQRALATRPAAVVVVHHFGIPTPIASIEAAAPPGTWVIEDAAQAHGGALDGRPLGSLAPLSVLSFGRGKGWTGGEGGALLLRGLATAAVDQIRRGLAPAGSGLTPAAKLAGQWALARPALYGLPASLPWLGLGSTRYVPPVLPRSMPPVVARLVLANAAVADRQTEIRRVNAHRLLAVLMRSPGLWVPDLTDALGALRLPVRIPGRASETVLELEARHLGILPSYPLPLPALEVVRGSAIDAGSSPGAAVLAKELFTAPTHSFLTSRDLDRIEALFRRLR